MVIFGVSFDSPEDNRAFREKFDFPFDLLSDTGREVGVAYGAADGTDAQVARRISYLIGPDGTIEKTYGEVQPAGHPDEVLRDLASLA